MPPKKKGRKKGVKKSVKKKSGTVTKKKGASKEASKEDDAPAEDAAEVLDDAAAMPVDGRETAEDDEVSKAWSEIVDDDGGDSYYYNSITGESSWERPECLDRFLGVDDEPAAGPTEMEIYNAWEMVEAGSTVYYYNPITNESIFVKPDPPTSVVELQEALENSHKAVETVYETDGTFNDLVSLTELSGGTAFAEDWAHGTDMDTLMKELEAKVQAQIDEEERIRLLEEMVKEPEQIREELFDHAATGGAEALKELAQLAEEYPDELNSVVDDTNTLGFTPLMVASRGGDLDVVQALLDIGADVDAKTSHDQSSALILACSAGAVDVMQTLIDNGADVEARDVRGMTPLMHAICTGQMRILKELMEQVRVVFALFTFVFVTLDVCSCTRAYARSSLSPRHSPPLRQLFLSLSLAFSLAFSLACFLALL